MGDEPPIPPRQHTPEAHSSGPFERHPFTPEQGRHVALMRAIAQELTSRTGAAFVLKGGTALLLAYDLPRFSIDLTESIQAGAAAAQLPVHSLRDAKHTPTVHRQMLHYRDDVMRPLKIEVSYRQAQQIDEDDVTTINGIRTYRLEKLASLKIDALVNRTKARDIFDTSFLLHRYPEAISDDDLTRIDQLIDLIGLNDLEAIMQDDDILNRFDLTHVAVSLVENVLRMRRER